MPDSSRRCAGCYLPTTHCMCADMHEVRCGVEVVVLRHVLECERSSNTGRLVGSAFSNARVLDYAHPQRPLDPSQIATGNSYLLYPTRGAKAPTQLPNRLVVLDASWSQARRMAQRIPELRGMPCLALPTPSMPLPRLRKGQQPEQMSTAEAVIAALRFLDQAAAADHLERLLRELVRRFAQTGHS